MKQNIEIKTASKEERLMVLSVALAAGIKWHGSDQEPTTSEAIEEKYPWTRYPVVSISAAEHYMSGSGYVHGRYNNLKEFLSLMASVIPEPKNIKTEVKISRDYTAVANESFTGVQVGCTFVAKNTIEEILRMLNTKGQDQ